MRKSSVFLRTQHHTRLHLWDTLPEVTNIVRRTGHCTTKRAMVEDRDTRCLYGVQASGQYVHSSLQQQLILI